jgi:hypothetical protein
MASNSSLPMPPAAPMDGMNIKEVRGMKTFVARAGMTQVAPFSVATQARSKRCRYADRG